MSTEQIRKLRTWLSQPGLNAANKMLLTKLLTKLESAFAEQVAAGSEAPSVAVLVPAPGTATATKPGLVITDIPDTIGAPDTAFVRQSVNYNEAQRRAIELAAAGKSFILTGAAGSGKTTTVQGIVDALMDSGRAGTLQAMGHAHLTSETPGIVLISFTNKAVENIKKRLPKELHKNAITSHKLLEYQPVYYEEFNEKTGRGENKMKFEATRHEGNPNPHTIRTLIIDEATMTDIPMWNKIIASLPIRTDPDLQVILVGDIQQLPPVFGKSIFIHAMQKRMETVELTEVHRQALESPILQLAHRILSGKVIAAPELPQWADIDKREEGFGRLRIQPWKQKRSEMYMLKAVDALFPALIDNGDFDPEKDAILCPQNVNLGVTKINEVIASKVAADMQAEVYEVFSGTERKYFRVGERVLHNKSEHRITKITKNAGYYGKNPRRPSTTMNYEGVESVPEKLADNDDLDLPEGMSSEEYVDSILASLSVPQGEDSPSKRAASHVITVVSTDTGEELSLSTSGEVNNLMLAYAITVHRSQGSEYPRVIVFLHHTHAGMLCRELLYVACTRAKEELLVLCESNSFVQGITTQKLPGKTIEEKVEAFDRVIRQQARRGIGNADQIPRGLHRFIEGMSNEDAVATHSA